MPISLSQLARSIEPDKTVVLFGAGSSAPSLAPTASDLANKIAVEFKLPENEFGLDEIASIVESQHSRVQLIQLIRKEFDNIKPTGGILNLPLYDWKSIFTTNYDTLVEQCYERNGSPLRVVSTNFDFTLDAGTASTTLFKLHGTIDKDISTGDRSRIIISTEDYDATNDFREQLYDRLKGDLAGGHLLIVGQSLQDPHIKLLANRAAEISKTIGGAWRISLLLYSPDEHRALLYEKKGFTVSFGGIDEFFSELAAAKPAGSAVEAPQDYLSKSAALRPVTLDVEHAAKGGADLSKMFNGSPASYPDIRGGLTFSRNLSVGIRESLENPQKIGALTLGASGVGKTTATRQAVLALHDDGWACWEHKDDHGLNADEWVRVSRALREDEKQGVLFIDDAHGHIYEVNKLFSALNGESLFNLKVVLSSTKNKWNPRVKSPELLASVNVFSLRTLHSNEIDRLIVLIEKNREISELVEETFAGFSNYERRRRLADRCEAETFVCLKNIFASERFDDIILREYSELQEAYQEIYKHVAVLEHMGVRVHRQLLIRLLGIESAAISAALSNLEEIVYEYSIDERHGIYGWRGRHAVIVGIITRYKFSSLEDKVRLISRVIDCISATYDIELRTVRDLCNFETGIGSIPNKRQQNVLFRKMMSVVPGERVPRHRLLRNLIDMGEFDKAETEIRIFKKDFGRDGPVSRYSIRLMIARAVRTEGLLLEDRKTILEEAGAASELAASQFKNNKGIHAEYCEAGIELHKLCGEYELYDTAMAALRKVEERMSDPEIGNMVTYYERRMQSSS